MKHPAAETLRKVDAFLEKTGMKASRFGRKVANNSMLVERMKTGNVKVGTLLKVQRFLAEHKP